MTEQPNDDIGEDDLQMALEDLSEFEANKISQS